MRAGFTQASVEPTRVYTAADAREFLSDAGLDADALAAELDGKVMGAFIRATKPEAGCGCGPSCCGGAR